MAAIKNRTTVKEYTICHKGTFNPAFGKVWSVYPSAWMTYEHFTGTWRNLPANWRELYDVVCKTYIMESVEIVTR